MKTLKFFAAFICIVVLVSCGTKSTPLPQGDVEDGWIQFTRDSSVVFKMYSKVIMDSNVYIANVKTVYSDDRYVFGKKLDHTKGAWIVDAELNKIQESGYIYYDSLGNVLYSDNHIINDDNWVYVTPGTIGEGAAQLAKILYDNEYNLQRCAEPIKVNWGKKEWYKFDDGEDWDRYLIIYDKTDSTYLAWYYARTKNFGKRFSFCKDYSDTYRVVYGVVKKIEINVDEKIDRILETYAADKYYDIVYDGTNEVDHDEWIESSDELIQGVKDYVEKYK